MTKPNIIAEGPFFALSITDFLPEELMRPRLEHISETAKECSCLRFVCIRNDSLDQEVLSRAAEAAAGTKLGIILESADPDCLGYVAERIGPCILSLTDPNGLQSAARISAETGCPLAIPGSDVQELMDNIESAESVGADDLIMNPTVRNMKACLETNTDLIRLRTEHHLPQAGYPLMTRTWSGEYALAVASVSVMRSGDLIVLDDLDHEACRVLDSLMHNRM